MEPDLKETKLESAAEVRRLRRREREAEALRVVQGIRRNTFVPMDPDWTRRSPEQIEAEQVARFDDNPDHSVYFLYCCGHVKIGYTSNDFISRGSALSNGTPVPTWHLFAMSGGRRSEYLLHQRFAQHRVIGEWFRFDQEIRDFIFEHGNEYDVAAVHEAIASYRSWLQSEASNFGLIPTDPYGEGE